MPSPMASSSMLACLAFVFASAGQCAAGPLNARQAETTSSGSAAAATSTITGYAHPLALSSLGTLAASQTPLSYASPPSAIPVPGAPPAAAAEVHQQQQALASASSSTPAGDAPTPVCTSIAGSSPTATLPSFCEPSLHVNAASFLQPRASDLGAALANVTIATSPDKVGCCAECARLYNCVAWRFVPVYQGKPTPHLPGGFDPWGQGNCDIVYYTGNAEDPDSGVTTDGAADLCPNGRVGELLDVNGTSANVPGPNGETDRWSNVYYNGWNEGSCGAPGNVFESGAAEGRGDPDTLCP
ncbi:hypothetical protein SLS62_004972 [Diatrype stigma]|uniref:Uncharacterized protein n=1 Tax=Diatrype stigma TaxID=117547 RepID=A0AAN9V3W7_9PEZI